LFFCILENSICFDYVTEKLLQRLNIFIVPVVLGGGSYKYFAPPRSFINSYDFDTPRDLAKYLNKLRRNHEEYMSYFWWRNYYKSVLPRNYFCDLCRKLNEPGNGDKIQYYRNIDK
jgi:hypothetical protein